MATAASGISRRTNEKRLVALSGPAVVGGMVCGAIARDARGPRWLAVLVFVLGVAFAIPVLRQPPSTEPRPAGIGMMEAMGKARQTPWTALLNPVIGALGVMVGGRRRGATA